MANVVNKLYGGTSAFPIYNVVGGTATQDTMEFEILGGQNHKCLTLILDLTAFAVAASLTLKVEGVDRVSGKTYGSSGDVSVNPNLLLGAAVTAVKTFRYSIGIGVTGVASLVVNDYVPPFFRVTLTQGNANSHTYTLSGLLM